MNLLYPTSKIKQGWDILILLAYIINVFYIPLFISFELPISFDNYRTPYIFFEVIPVWIFVIDIFITLNTAYYSKVTKYFFLFNL